MRIFLINLTVLLLFGFYSCQNDTSSDTIIPEESTPKSFELSESEITGLLTGYLQNLQQNNPTTRGRSPIITTLNKVRYNNPVVTRAGDVKDNSFTICNIDLLNGDKPGFAIVLADRRLPVVLAYSPNGKYSDLKEQDNENLIDYVENIPNDIMKVFAQPRYLSPELTDTAHQWKGFPYDNSFDEIYTTSDIYGVTHDVALLHASVLWGQRNPYNKHLPINPNTGEPFPVGCVNVALSQIMAYYKQPTKYDWTSMTRFINIEHNLWAPAWLEDTIGMFIKDLTGISNTKFDPEKDRASNDLQDCINALNTLNFAHNAVIYFNSTAIRTSLKSKKFVLAFGKSILGRAHAIVFSGYWKFTLPQEQGSISGINIGVNWGTAGGWGDGWYLVEYGDMDITKLGLAKYDPYSQEYGTDFSEKLILIPGICPK